MVDVSKVRDRLRQVAHLTRIVMRCLSSGRDAQEPSQRVLTLLIDILDLLYRIKDQISWAEEKWLVQGARLNDLNELLGWFDSTLKAIELYFHPGGVGVRYFRKHLLERTFFPRLEQYKIIFVLSMQPESTERSTLGREIRSNLKRFRDVEPASLKLDLQLEDDALRLTSRLSSEHFVTLADLCNRRHQGTCRWILEDDQYKQWLLGSFRTLYCVGPPGAGKTFLSSVIVDSLQRTFTSPDVATVFIFCQDEKEKEQTSINILQNILAQLVYRKRSLSHTTASLYNSESLIHGSASPKAYQNAIRAEVNRFSKVFIIIDGLDMFSDKGRILHRLQKLPEQAQLLVTLRESTFQDKVGYLGVLAVPADLRLYVLSRIEQDTDFARLLQQGAEKPNLKQEVIRLVVEKSHGLFLLAKLHMNLLSRYSDRNLLERALQHLPESLSEAYGEIMKQVVSQNIYASRYIYWTLYACRPLTVTELKHAVKRDPEKEEWNFRASFEQNLLMESSGLLTVDAVTGTVRLVHKTAREYLEGTAARVFFPRAQKEIAETCLSVISSDGVVDDCYINHGATPRNSTGSLVSYAAANWGYHAREVADDEQTVQVLVKTFLNKFSWRRPPFKNDSSSSSSSSSVQIESRKEIPKELGLGRYPHDWNGLHILAHFGITAKSKRLIEQGTHVDVHDNSLKITPLHCAAYRGNEAMVEFLLDHGADINAKNKNGSTALHLATENGHRKVIKLLLNRRANFKSMNLLGATCLHVAVGTATDEATVPLLIKNRVDANVQNATTGGTALHLAVKWRRPRILLFLLEKGAAINVMDEQGLTPLQVAAKMDNTEAISLLLQRDAHVEARTLSGVTALHLAAHEGHWVAFDLLLIGGADINAWTKEGETLLHEQARKSPRRNISIAAKLLDQGANIEARSSQGYTPLQCAAMSGNKDMFTFLLGRGAKIDVETARGETLLHLTPPCNSDCLDILKILLLAPPPPHHHRLDVNAVSSKGWTPLHQTVYAGTGTLDITFDSTAEYIDLLLTCGADINAPSTSSAGETPLHLAAMAPVPRPSLVSLLLANGASVNATTDEGKTALHLAAERGRESIFRILLDAGADTSTRTPASATADDGHGGGGGDTAFDLARKNPFGHLWFDDHGNLRPPPVRSRRDSVATTIEDIDSDEETETGESTLVGE